MRIQPTWHQQEVRGPTCPASSTKPTWSPRSCVSHHSGSESLLPGCLFTSEDLSIWRSKEPRSSTKPFMGVSATAGSILDFRIAKETLLLAVESDPFDFGNPLQLSNSSASWGKSRGISCKDDLEEKESCLLMPLLLSSTFLLSNSIFASSHIMWNHHMLLRHK